MLVAAAAMAFTSCQKEETAAPETVSATLTMHAGVEQTKTYLGEGNKVLWGKGEAVKLYVGAGETAKFFDSASTDAYDGEASASFTFAIEDVAQVESYALGGIYPASAAMDDNKNAAQYKVILPATQNQVDGNYDPSAYIMVLKPEVVTELPAEYTASFRRAVALNKITLTGVKEDISSVEITVPEEKYLAGRRYMNLTTGESGEVYENGGRTNTIKVNSAYPAGTIDVWFTSWGVELAAGQELTVKMISPSKIYTRTITAKEGGIKFVEGDLNKLTVSMASATEEVNTDLSGDYLIASVPKSWNLMSGTNGGKYYSHIVSGVTTSATEVKCADFYSVAGVNNCIWTVEKMGDNYSIKNKTTGKYVSYSGSENEAYTSDTAVEFALSENDGVMTVESKAVAGRKLKYNSSSPRFAFYTTDQTPLYFIPWEADTTPRIFVNENNYEVEAAEGSIDIVYTTNDLVTGQIEASVKSGASMTINSTSVGDGKVTVNYAANTAQEPKTATIVLSYDGAESQEVVITQAAAGATKQYYVKVTTAPTDWSGTYLIVAGTSVATAIDGSWLKYATATINDNKIEATATTNAYAVTIQKVASQSYYTIKLANGQYLGTPNSNSIKQSTSVASDFYWKFSVSNSLVKIEANSYSGRILRLNGTSGFRTYTSNTGTQATLYRLEGGESGGETPEIPVEPVKLSTPVVKCSDSDITENSLKFTWDAIANASKYEVTFNNGTPTETTNTYYEATGLNANTNYSISVKAVGDGVNYTTSDAGTATGTTKEEQQSGGGDDSAESVTVSNTIAELADANSWNDATKYTTVNLDEIITASVSGGSNTGKYYVNGENWRIYQNETPSLKISAVSGYTIKTVKITYTVSNSGILTYNSSNITSGTVVNVNAASIAFGVGNTGSATNGQVRVTAIEVVYQKN